MAAVKTSIIYSVFPEKRETIRMSIFENPSTFSAHLLNDNNCDDPASQESNLFLIKDATYLRSSRSISALSPETRR